jgi:pilus assembly protein TadC
MNYIYVILGIIVTYILSIILSVTKVTAGFKSLLFYFAPVIGFLLLYVIFKYIETRIKFNFKEYYIGIILLVFLFLGFYVAFLIYYGQTAIFSSVTFSQIFDQLQINWLSYMAATPYVYFIIGAFFGWLAYALEKKK